MAFSDAGSGDVFAPAGAAGGFDVKKFLGILRRFFWILFLTVPIGVGAAYAYLKSTPPEFRSTAEIRVERRSATATVAMNGAAALEGATTPEDLKTIEQSFVSPRLMKRVAEKLGLAQREGFLGLEASTGSEGDLISFLMDHTHVALVEDTRLIQVSFTYRDADTAQEVANAIVEQGIENDQEQRVEALSGSVAYLRTESKRLEASLKASEEKLNDYTRKLGSVSIDQSLNIVAEQLRDLNNRQTAAKTERLKLESDYEQIRSILNDPDKLLAIESIRKVPAVERLYLRAGELNGQLVKLEQRYRPQNPLVIQLQTELKQVNTALDAEILQAPRSVEVALATARRNEDSLVREQAAQEARVIEIRGLSIESQVLQRQIDADKLAYESTLKRLNEELAQARSQPVLLQLVEPAGPGLLTNAQPVRILGMGLIGGLLVGGGLIFLLMQLDSSIKTIEEAEAAFGVSVLSAVPEYAGGTKRSPQRGGDLASCPILHDSYAAAAEAFRTLRASVLLSGEASGGGLVLVTSTVPAEGKSFCALNLAAAMAHSGLRTLLVDAHLRKPALEGRLFGSQGHRGLADFLQGKAAFSSVIQPTSVSGLDAVTAGSPSAHPAELLSRPAFQDFLNEAQPNYDWIIFDSASVSPVSDTLSIARFFSTVCLILRSGRTPRRAAVRAIELLARSGARPAGVVMNFASQKLALRDSEYLGVPATNGARAEVDPKNRRDDSDVGRSRREVFGEILDRLLAAGLPANDARARLLLALKVSRGETFDGDASDATGAERHRHDLFHGLVAQLQKAGWSHDEARRRLLDAIKIWQGTP